MFRFFGKILVLPKLDQKGPNWTKNGHVQFFLGKGSLVFSDFLHEIRGPPRLKFDVVGFFGKILVLPKLGQKGVKCNFWPYYPNALFLLVKIWQDLLENDFVSK